MAQSPSQPVSLDNPSGHLVPETVLERLDSVIDEKYARELSAHQYPNTPVEQLRESNLRGVAYEGMYQRHLTDQVGEDHVIPHPDGMVLDDKRSIKPDFAVTDDDGRIVTLHDAKGYTRKETHNPDASASSLTHMQSVEYASRYVNVDHPDVRRVTFGMPLETANMPNVQDAVGAFGSDDRPVNVEGVGTEAEIKQHMADLQAGAEERFALSDDVRAEIERIQALPIEERRQMMGDFVLSLRDDKGDETAMGRNIRWSTRVERGGEGVTILDSATGKEYTVWY